VQIEGKNYKETLPENKEGNLVDRKLAQIRHALRGENPAMMNA
jgi:hypothetical protein